MGMKKQLEYWQENKKFLCCFPMKKVKVTSRFAEFQILVWYQYTLKKSDPDMHSFRVNGIFTKNQTLLHKLVN